MIFAAIIPQIELLHLEGLDLFLDGGQLDRSAVDALAIALASDNMPCLSHVTLYLGTNGVKEGVISRFLLGFGQGACLQLQSMILPMEYMKDDDFLVLAEMLEARAIFGCTGMSEGFSFQESVPAEIRKRIIRSCLPTITSLHLTSHGQSELYLECLASIRPYALRCLEVNDIGQRQSAALFHSVADGHFPSLETIRFSGNEQEPILHGEAFDHMIAAIKKGAGHIHSLSLNAACLTVDDIDRLLKAIACRPALKESWKCLNLRNNPDIGDAGTELVAKVIEERDLLDDTLLSLAGCEVTDKGLAALISACKIKQPATL